MAIRFQRQFTVLGLAFLLLASCAPPTVQVSEGSPTPAQENEVDTAVLGCVAGGLGVFTPEDVRCYLDSFEPEFVRELDEETAVLFTDPNSIADWVGGAIIYHIPSVSSLVLDRNGDVDPQFSTINNRAALVAFSELAANPASLAELKLVVQQNWQTTDSGQPEVRLGLAWQDGITSIFMIALAGLPIDDARFYCPEEAWRIGDEEIRIVADCVVRDPDLPIHHLLFARQEIRSNQPQLVQVALDDVASNELQVAKGEITTETAVYQAAITYAAGGKAVVLRGETTATLPEAEATLTDSVDPALLQSFLAANQASASLRFLFYNHHNIFPQPGEVVERDYLPADGETPNCAYFRREFSGLTGGVVTVSQLGFSEDGRQAVLFLQQACGATTLTSRYLLLELQGDFWQMKTEFGRVEVADTPLTPGLVYNGRNQGCGDIFLYKANNENRMSEYLVVGIDARAFDLSAEPLTLELSEHPETVTVKVDLFGARVYNLGEFPYCNDVGPAAEPYSVWQAESGTITVSINGEVPEESCTGEGYEVTVRLENVVLRNGSESVTLVEELFENVPVGWCAG